MEMKREENRGSAFQKSQSSTKFGSSDKNKTPFVKGPLQKPLVPGSAAQADSTSSSSSKYEQPKASNVNTTELCKGCGKTGHARDTCKCTSSPYLNTQDTIYKLSPAWKELVNEYSKIK